MARLTLIAVAALLGVAAGAVAAEHTGVDLAELAGWDIVSAEDASPSEVYAAEEFRSIFAQATGIELATVTVPEDKRPLEAAQAEKMRPLVEKMCQLCVKYEVPMFGEWTSLDEAKERLRANLGLSADDPLGLEPQQ